MQGKGGPAPLFLNLGNMSVVSLGFWPLYPLNRRLGAPQSCSECFGEVKNICMSTYIHTILLWMYCTYILIGVLTYVLNKYISQ